MITRGTSQPHAATASRSTTTRPATRPNRGTIPGYFGVLTALTLLAAWAVYQATLPENLDSRFGNLFHWPIDFRVYYNAGLALTQGDDLYAHPFVGDLPFTYPPFAGAIFRGLAFAEPHPMAIAWQVASLLVLLLVIIAVLRSRGYALRPGLIILAVIGLVASFNLSPVFGTFYFGQINIFLMGLVALDFLRGRGAFGRGIFSGIAAGIKLTPAFFLMPFILERRWRAVILMVVTFAATIGIGFLAVPDASSFWTDKVYETNRIGGQNNPGAESLQAVLERMNVADEKLIWALGSAAILVAFCIAARGAIVRGNLALVMVLGGITAALISPFSWYHHWVYVVPLFFVLLDATLRPLTSLTERLRARWPKGSAVAAVLEQCGGFAAVALWTVVFLPFASPIGLWDMSFHAQGRSADPLFAGMFVWAGCALVAGCALYFFIADVARKLRVGRASSAAPG